MRLPRAEGPLIVCTQRGGACRAREVGLDDAKEALVGRKAVDRGAGGTDRRTARAVALSAGALTSEALRASGQVYASGQGHRGRGLAGREIERTDDVALHHVDQADR